MGVYASGIKADSHPAIRCLLFTFWLLGVGFGGLGCGFVFVLISRRACSRCGVKCLSCCSPVVVFEAVQVGEWQESSDNRIDILAAHPSKMV